MSHLTQRFRLRPLFILMGWLALASCADQKAHNDWHSLFEGSDLSKWDTYLGPKKFDQQTGEKLAANSPQGLNNDPNHVFSITDVDGEKALHISGELFGGISTKETFENYHLQLQFKWGKLKWIPKTKAKRDSGLLYHAVGPHGADNASWMRSQEFQIQEGDCGDYWGVAGGIFDVKAKMNQDSTFVYDENGPLLTFSATSVNGRHCLKYPDTEKTSGEWNTIDLYCSGDTSVHAINGVVNMILYHSRQLEKGKEMPLTKGKIQLQSEGAEIYYRNIRIRSINRLPDNILKKSTAEVK